MKTKPVNSSVGLYVTSRAASCAQVSGTIKAPVVLTYSKCGFADIKHEPKSIIASEAQEEATLELVRCVSQKSGISSGDILTAISDKDVLVRYFEMAEVPKSERDSAVRFEARKYIPYKIEDVVSSFYVREEKLHGKRMGVLFVAAKKDSVGSHIVMLRKAGFRPVAIDASCLALLRLFNLTNQLDRKSATMIVHVADDETAHIYIAKDDIIYLTRTITLIGDLPSSQEKIISELEVSRDYFFREHPQLEMGKIILTGEGDMEEFRGVASEKLGIVAELGDPMRFVKGEIQLGHDSCVAVGLALLGLMDVEKAKVNLLPETLMVRKEEFLRPVLIQGALILVVLFAVQFLFLMQMKSLQENLSSVNAGLGRFENSLKSLTISELTEKKDNLNIKAKFLRDVIGEKVDVSEKFSKITDALPEEAFFIEASYKEDISLSRSVVQRYPEKVSRKVLLKGMIAAGNQQEEIELANAFAAALKDSKDFLKGFSDVELKSTRIDKFEGIDVTNFEIEVSSK